MKLVSILEMQKADKYTIEQLGIPGEKLMHRAALAVVNEVMSIAGSKFMFTVAVFCGPGNNGGDGWATAIMLRENGIETTVFTGCSPDELRGDAAFYANKAIENGITVIEATVPANIFEFDIVIDALFGIGLHRKIEGLYKKFILLMNNQAKYVISVDIPSGLYSDEGIPYDFAVKADKTVTFGKAKTLLISQPGCTYAGKVIVNDIGIPDEAYKKEKLEYIAVDSTFIREKIKPREKISSKGNYGRVLLITGSPGMTGATGLCAESCLRSGSGLVYCAVPKNKIFEYDSLVREAISVPVEDGGKHYISSEGIKDIMKAARTKTAVVIGPGLSPESDSHVIFYELTKIAGIPVIADAQTLNDISNNAKQLENAKSKIIVTPHPGEMSRMTGKTINSIQESRITTAVEFAREHSVIVLLKGHRTIVTNGSIVYINTTGNPGMATAGSGDVLCGVIASCTAIIDDIAEAAATAAYIHGAAGDRASIKYGEYSMKAGDIINEIPWVIKNIAGV